MAFRVKFMCNHQVRRLLPRPAPGSFTSFTRGKDKPMKRAGRSYPFISDVTRNLSIGFQPPAMQA